MLTEYRWLKEPYARLKEDAILELDDVLFNGFSVNKLHYYNQYYGLLASFYDEDEKDTMYITYSLCHPIDQKEKDWGKFSFREISKKIVRNRFEKRELFNIQKIDNIDDLNLNKKLNKPLKRFIDDLLRCKFYKNTVKKIYLIKR